MNPADLALAKDPLASGAFGDVFRGQWRGVSVAAKRLKGEFQTDARALAELRAELSIWCRLHHVSAGGSRGTQEQQLPQEVGDSSASISYHDLLCSAAAVASAMRRLTTRAACVLCCLTTR